MYKLLKKGLDFRCYQRRLLELGHMPGTGEDDDPGLGEVLYPAERDFIGLYRHCLTLLCNLWQDICHNRIELPGERDGCGTRFAGVTMAYY